MSFTNVVDTLTLEDIVPQVVDTVLRANTFTTAVLTKTKKFKAATQDFPIKFKVGTAVQSFIGFDTLPTTFTDTRVLMKFNPAFVTANVAVAGTDIASNNTDRKILDLTEVEMESRAQDLADAVGNMFWGTGQGNNSKDFLGLLALIDDGTTVSTIGGLSRSTYPTLASTVTSTTTISFPILRTAWNAIADAEVVPSRCYTDYSTWGLIEQLLQPTERIMKDVNLKTDFKGFTGFQAFTYSGMEIVPDRKGPAGTLVMINEKFLNFWALDTSLKVFDGAEKVNVAGKLFTGNSYNEVSNLGFYWTGFIKVNNAFAFNSFIVLAGNLLTDNPRRHARLTNITGI